MKQFFKDYNNYIEEILNLGASISGKHGIDKHKAEQWINSQLSERRRKAAQFLLDHTNYVTFNEVIENLKNCIIRIYKDIDISKDIYIYVGPDRNSSFYFFALIGLYYIKTLNYKCPVKAVRKIKPDFQQYIVLDDCAYTGGQFLVRFCKHYHSYTPSCKYMCDTKNSIIYAGFAVAFRGAYFRILKYNDIGYNIKLYTGHMFEDLSIENPIFKDVLYYFSPYMYGNPKRSLYFDHKMADPVSTFMKILQYGPILPPKLNYSRIILEESLIYDDCFGDYFGGNGIMTMDEFNEYYKGQLMEEEELVKKETHRQALTFIPFLTNFKFQFCIPENTSYHVFSSMTDLFNITKYSPYSPDEKKLITLLYDTKKRYPPSIYQDLFTHFHFFNN